MKHAPSSAASLYDYDFYDLYKGVDLNDEMTFRKLPPTASKDELTCSDKSLSIDGSNLVIKVKTFFLLHVSFIFFIILYIFLKLGVGVDA